MCVRMMTHVRALIGIMHIRTGSLQVGIKGFDYLTNILLYTFLFVELLPYDTPFFIRQTNRID